MGRRAAREERDASFILSEVEGVVCLALGAVLALSFVSYSPENPEINKVGPVGHWLAALLVQGFGFAAYLFPALLGAGAVALFVRREMSRAGVRLAGALGLLFEVSIVLGLYLPGVEAPRAGGWIGGFLATLLRETVGTGGSSVVMAACGLLIWLMLTGTPLSEMVARVVAAVLRALKQVAVGIADGVRLGIEHASGFSPRRLARAAAGGAGRGAVADEPPIVFGNATTGSAAGAEREVEVDKKRAESIVQITARPEPKAGRKSKKGAEDEEKEQEEFHFQIECDDYQLPPVRFLGKHDEVSTDTDERALVAQSKILEQKLATFNVTGRVTAVRPGPVITTFEFEPEDGIKVSRVVNLCDDLTMALRAHGVRIVAPIPGKNVVGIEVSNRNRAIVGLRDLIDSDEFRNSKQKLPLALGRDTVGAPTYADLTRMPHLLMAGATGTGKSVSLNAIILSLLYRCTPRDARFIMIDPKMLELSLYEGIPHLLVPVVTDVKKAAAALANVMREMDRRFELMKDLQVRSIDDYNQRIAEMLGSQDDEDEELEDDDEYEEELDGEELDGEELEDDEEYEDDEEDEESEEEEEASGAEEEEAPRHEHLPRIVVIVDELADLMMTVGREVETSITRLAQKARAAGIHLIVATQRPSVDVITGLIKANFPSRISFQVTSRPDSRTILDAIGAERLLGNGDMLYMAPGTSFMQRLHGAYVTDREARAVVEWAKKQGGPDYKMDLLEDPAKQAAEGEDAEEFFDELYDKAVDLVIENGQGSTSWIQRKLGIGYNRAARIMEHMEREGVVGPADGVKPRKALVGPHAG